MPPARVTNRPRRQHRLHRRPDHIHHLRLQSAHDEIGLHGLSCSGQPDQYTGEPANPWMANPRGLLVSVNDTGDLEFVELRRERWRLVLNVAERLAENLHDFGKR